MSEDKTAEITIRFREGVGSADITLRNASPAHLYAAAGLINYEADKARTALDFQNAQEIALRQQLAGSGGLKVQR
jgi:hypothetical protein